MNWAVRGVRRDLLVLVEHHRGVRPLLRIDTDNRLDGSALIGPTRTGHASAHYRRYDDVRLGVDSQHGSRTFDPKGVEIV
ncbi:MAG: hypothetical protein R6W79_01850 [Acidimicrobiia bacterium]